MAIKLKITNGNYSAEGTSATIKCNGKKLASDIVIECVEEAEVKLISFTFGGFGECKAVDGWTFADWKGSEYDVTGGTWFFDSGNMLVTNSGSYVTYNGKTIYGYDEIVGGASYTIHVNTGGSVD